MRNTPGLIFYFAAALLCSSCATYHPHIHENARQQVSADEGLHRLFLIGDAGEDTEGFRQNMALLQRRLAASDIPATVVFLGDNIYPHGVPNKEDSAAYADAVHILNAQIAGANGAARTVFIPGNHDWNKGHAGGLKAIRKQGKLVRESDEAELLPKKGCPGPEAIELTDDAVLIIIDSQWWLEDWRLERDINEDCEIRTREDLIGAFAEMLKDYQERQIIVAMHHPLVSSGPHGGYFTLSDHMFPLRNIRALKNVYLPLPVLGSIYPVYRSNFGNVQDIANHKYQDLRNGLLETTKFYDHVVFASGHEHALEYHVKGDQHFLVSGSGCKKTPIGHPRTMEYGHAENGFMQLNVLEKGALDLVIWEGNEDAPVFEQHMTPGVPGFIDTLGGLGLSDLPDTVRMEISDAYDKSGLHRFAFGERYRDLYAIPVPVEVLDLTQAEGGLTPVKKGGGFQTNSLRLMDNEDREYSARSMNKSVSKLLPETLQNTFASDILQDQFTASHPYAAFVIPGLADAAGVYHTNPRLVYIPVQKRLGRYAADFGDGLYLFEERPSSEWSSSPNFGGCRDIVGFDDVIEETMQDYRNQVDQAFVARSRLFDMFLGDWDRHDDQWRWAECAVPDGKGHVFRPIPRDRDQAFSRYDGALVSAAKLFTPGIRKLSLFHGDIPDLRWFNDNGKTFDRDFLNQLPQEEWTRVAGELRTALTDEVIEQEIRKLPPEIYAEGGDALIATLKARRDHLPEFAGAYYTILARKVKIRGTLNADYIEIQDEPSGVTVRLFDSNKEGEKHEQYYTRRFVKKETDVVQIYGLDGHDRIVISGAGGSGIRIYCVGGEDEDKVSVTEGRHGKICIQDTETRSDVVPAGNIAYTQVGDDKNAYDRSEFQYNYGIPKIVLGANPDDGFLIGGGAQWVRHGFQKEPFASRHSVDAFYAFATSSYGLHYEGLWTDRLGKMDIGVQAKYEGPTFVQNFFGYGNDSEEKEGEDLDFYRVRKSSYGVVPFLQAGKESGSSFRLKAGLEGHEVEENTGRFVASDESGLSADVFDRKEWVVTEWAYQYRVTDHPTFVRRGVDFDFSVGVDVPLQSGQEVHRYLKTSLATYYRFKHLGQPVLATRIGTEFHGGDYQFYQGAILGAQDNFRGMRKERLTGDRLFYHNTDLRVVLTRWHSYFLPAAMGFQLNFDHGRVWYDGEDSDTWHYAYGGGLWLGLFEAFLISVNYHKSDLDQRFSVGMGFMF